MLGINVTRHHQQVTVTFADKTIVRQEGDVTSTTFPNGSTCSNWPPASADYEMTARWLGFDDLGAYNFEHEVTHILAPLVMFGERGYVSWMAAQGRKMSLAAAKAEERLVWMVQAGAAGRIEPPPGCEEAVQVLVWVREQVKHLGAMAVVRRIMREHRGFLAAFANS